MPRGGGRWKVRDDDARGGTRETMRPDARTRGPAPDLVALVREVRTKFGRHATKFSPAELEELGDEASALVRDVKDLQSVKIEEWQGEIL